MIYKALTDPTLFTNAGSFRALNVITEPGSVFHATGSAPHGYYFETRIRLYDMLWRCMAGALPERLPAGHFASICGTVIAGDHPDTGRRYTMVEPQMGGWGATAERDGLDAMYSASHGETFNCPVEICEARYGIDVGWKRLTGGARSEGRHRGGRGVSLSYRPRGAAILSAGYSRNRIPAWGSAGGGPGGTNSLSVVRADGTLEDYAFVSGLLLEPGDEIRITTANGGAWGKGGLKQHHALARRLGVEFRIGLGNPVKAVAVGKQAVDIDTTLGDKTGAFLQNDGRKSPRTDQRDLTAQKVGADIYGDRPSFTDETYRAPGAGGADRGKAGGFGGRTIERQIDTTTVGKVLQSLHGIHRVRVNHLVGTHPPGQPATLGIDIQGNDPGPHGVGQLGRRQADGSLTEYRQGVMT